ncbi:MAG: tetratricopeptide repeat protein, partial [Mariniphaga sp.]|nr:tetratricopeptide repeat protein [Mariniphaga sp.]
MKTIRLIIIPLGLLLCTYISFGQKTEYYTDIQDRIRIAKELFGQEKFNASYRQFEKVQEEVGSNSEIYSEAEYYKAYALLKSGQNNGDRKMNDFIADYPESPYMNKARFNLGSYQFDKNRYSVAIRTLNMVDAGTLNEKESVLIHYQLGYSYMEQENLEKAAAEFFEIKDANNIYSKPASYYWAHINYLNENYESALNGLRKLDGDPSYSQVIPLYVSHIFYKQEKYDQIVDYTTGIIEDVDESHQPELAKIIGDSYFHLNDFEKAIPYLERYHKSRGPKSNEDNYLLGYSYYTIQDFGKAIPYLEKATKGKNNLAQNAFYHLADCYVRTDNKEKARFAFEAASEFDFDDKIKEDALFNYAKITYELSYSPFSETIKAFDKYISLYPNSERNNSAYQYLVRVY